jgi:hypothetical protein
LSGGRETEGGSWIVVVKELRVNINININIEE